MTQIKKLIKEIQILKEEVVNLKKDVAILKETPKLDFASGFDFDKFGFII